MVHPSWHFKSQEKLSHVRNQAVYVSLQAELSPGSSTSDQECVEALVWAIVLDSRRIVAFDDPLRHHASYRLLKVLVGECVSGGVVLPGQSGGFDQALAAS
jgi:hypothetical protein